MILLITPVFIVLGRHWRPGKQWPCSCLTTALLLTAFHQNTLDAERNAVTRSHLGVDWDVFSSLNGKDTTEGTISASEGPKWTPLEVSRPFTAAEGTASPGPWFSTFKFPI